MKVWPVEIISFYDFHEKRTCGLSWKKSAKLFILKCNDAKFLSRNER